MREDHPVPELPCSIEIQPAPTVPDVLSRFADWEGLILFESVRRHPRLGRYSFLAIEPIEYFVTDAVEFGHDPFTNARQISADFSASTDPTLPPFQGGFAGLLSYDLGRCWERLPIPAHDEFQIPACVIGVYDKVITWDHVQNRCWAIAHGDAASVSPNRNASARAKCHELVERIEHSPLAKAPISKQVDARNVEIETKQFSIDETDVVMSNFSKHGYLEAVQRVIDYIVEGDLFQANLSQRLMATTTAATEEIYHALRTFNPSPFAGLFQYDDWAVLSSSPERFIQKAGDQIWTRPIKGTRQRRTAPEADLFTRDELRESEKDQSENVMIVDLLRNDLSRVCRPGTIRVPELCSIETYETVTHLVSEVTGMLQDGMTFWDVLQATFPGGSITGAPKIRAMQVITELERVARGPYCGSLFYCGFDGTADSNILIRTLTKRGNKLAFPAGGGIVSQSIPQMEYEETQHKAAGMLAAIRSCNKS